MTTNLDPHARQVTLHDIIDACPVPMALNDRELNITFVNTAFRRTFGYTLQDIPALADWWVKACPDAHYRQKITETWQSHIEETLQEGDKFTPLEAIIHCRNGGTKTRPGKRLPHGASLRWAAPGDPDRYFRANRDQQSP